MNKHVFFRLRACEKPEKKRAYPKLALINAISSNLSQDFNVALFDKKGSIRSCQVITALIAIAGVFGSFYFNNVVDILIQSYELSVSCLFVPIFAAFFRQRGNVSAAVLSIALGAAGFCLFRIYPLELPIPREILSVLLSAVGFAVGEALAWKQRCVTEG